MKFAGIHAFGSVFDLAVTRQRGRQAAGGHGARGEGGQFAGGGGWNGSDGSVGRLV